MLSPEQLKWHLEQHAEPKRSTVALREFVSRVTAGGAPTQVLDVACGAGANMAHLAHLWPDAQWTGLDLNGELVSGGRELLDHERFSFVQGDLYRLTDHFEARQFDVSFSIMTLSWIEDYELAVQQMLSVTREWVFILNLFSETELDAFIRVMGRMPGDLEGYAEYYNIYSLPRFEWFCRDQYGVREIIAEPFEIDIDLPRPAHRGMGSYTEMMADGRRLQFSGPLLMPWWLVALRPGD